MPGNFLDRGGVAGDWGEGGGGGGKTSKPTAVCSNIGANSALQLQLIIMLIKAPAGLCKMM